jgi:hypothetical protein
MSSDRNWSFDESASMRSADGRTPRNWLRVFGINRARNCLQNQDHEVGFRRFAFVVVDRFGVQPYFIASSRRRQASSQVRHSSSQIRQCSWC